MKTVETIKMKRHKVGMRAVGIGRAKANSLPITSGRKEEAKEIRLPRTT